ncbi:MAG: hypothetical protein WCB57_13495 [Pseudonocardiaceae bacterium]
MGAKPDVLVATHVCIGLEMRTMRSTHTTVRAVTGHDQIGVRELGKILDLAVELDVDSDVYRPLDQDVEKVLATDGEPIPSEVSPLRPADVYLLIGPGRRTIEYHPGALWVVVVEAVEQRIGECDAPSVRHPSRVAFDHRDVAIWIAQLRGNGEVQAGGSAADAHDFHALVSLPD